MTMLQRELQKHQWKAFVRHPAFQKNIILKVFMGICFAILGAEFFLLGLFLDRLLLQTGLGDNAIDIFNSALLYLLLFDFTIKYIFKKLKSMQIAPYLTLPVKRKNLFNFLLIKEFSNIWNLYFLFLVVPFAFRSITPDFGFFATLSYIIFFYSLCIGNSLLVNAADYISKRKAWFVIIPFIAVAAIIGIAVIPDIHFGVFTVKLGQWILHHNLLVWICQLLILAGLWLWNLSLMREGLYRELQGKKVSSKSRMFNISFLDRFGEIGNFINLEIKMLWRAKRLKQQLFALVIMLFFFYFILYSSAASQSYNFFNLLFFGIFSLGGLGLIMSQFMFTAESSFFDGLMARNHSLINMLKGKYYLYVAYGFLVALLMMIPVAHGKLTFLFVISLFFYTSGLVFFGMFQNAVYNKSYMDLFDGGMMNWKGTSGNMVVTTLLGMLLPFILVFIIHVIFSLKVTCYFMLITGLVFTLTHNIWLKWIYKRFLKRKYTNMEGFRSNT